MSDQYALLTVRQVATMMRISPTSVRSLIRAGRLRAVRLQHHIRVPEISVASFITECGRPGAQP